MKRVLLCLSVLFILIAFTSFDATAQNANRKGWVLELQGGRAFGTLYESENFKADKVNGKPAYRRSGGITGAFNFGYRWTTSRFCAVEAKLHIEDNFSAPEDMLLIGIMPGFRYTTRELTGNTSMYMGINAGAAIAINGGEGVFVPTEANVGFNFGNNFCVGVFVDYNICINGEYWVDFEGTELSLDIERKSFPVVGLKVGLRF